ncbi:5'/3'-nucleotidase SurE, partial [Streptomyces griseoloalbus]|uniref:5'/3'-nucleotidase SurE n=1 Tax=Streptomyces griseoloalbus TaxID=67303 RepID=UPI00296F3282
MQSSRPLILITNDDSVDAPGIHHLAECVRSLGDVYIVAPAHPHSGQSAALTVGAPLRIVEKPSATDGVRLFTVNGTPVDCIKLALHTIVPRQPDIIFSGINHGSNSAVNVLYSGTMGAAIEASFYNIPAIGLSVTDHAADADFAAAVEYGVRIAGAVLENKPQLPLCLN